MKDREIRLLALFSMVLVFGFMLPTSAAALNSPEREGSSVVTAGLGIASARPELALALSPTQCTLNISSTIGGSVISPGEGAFTYEKGTVVDLVAEPEEGYLFVQWTGDVNTISNIGAATTSITMDGDYSIRASFTSLRPAGVGVKTGDWMKLTYNITGLPAGQPYLEWLKLDFVSVNGTMATVRVTVHYSNGLEQSNTATVDVASGSEIPQLAGIVVPANRATGDRTYIAGYGDVTIEGEATRTYAGVDRTVLYASFSQNDKHVTYYWDKLTGVVVEIASTSTGTSGTARATETNMWGAPARAGMSWWPWIIVAAAVVVGVTVFFVRRRGRAPAAAGEVKDQEPEIKMTTQN